MSIPFVYLPEADDDVERTCEHYERERPGLGDEFLEALRDAVDRICENPQRYGVARRDIRAALLKAIPLRRILS